MTATVGGQNATFVLDFATSLTWLPSSTCLRCTGRPLPVASRPSDRHFQVEYAFATGSWAAGRIVSAPFSIAGLRLSSYSLGAADHVTQAFNGAPFDGVMGLALAQPVGTTQPLAGGTRSPLEALAAGKHIPSAALGVAFGRGGAVNSGELHFGSADKTKFTGSLTTVDSAVDDSGFWSVPISRATPASLSAD